MNLFDVRIGSEYVHDDLGRCLVVGIHPADPSSWVIQVLDSETAQALDITESKFLQPVKS